MVIFPFDNTNADWAEYDMEDFVFGLSSEEDEVIDNDTVEGDR